MHPSLVNILNYLQDHYHEHPTLDSIAAKYMLNKSHLCHLFKKELHLSFTNYLNQLRLTAANRLLAETNDCLETIAAKTGFLNDN